EHCSARRFERRPARRDAGNERAVHQGSRVRGASRSGPCGFEKQSDRLYRGGIDPERKVGGTRNSYHRDHGNLAAMTAAVSINDVTAASGVKATPSFSVKPLMAASMASTAAMMAFVSVIGPMAHILKLPPWQAGTVLTVGGVLWMLLSRAWGTVSDRLGRRSILLAGMIGFTLSYWAMCAWAVVALRVLPDAWLVFAGLVVTRGAVGAFYAAIPLVGQALVADNLPPAERAGTLATLGAANGAGLVLGPALAAVLTPFSLVLPLYATAIVPLAASVILWKTLPVSTLKTSASVTSVRLTHSRLRRHLTL